MDYRQWMELVGELKSVHELVVTARDTDLTSRTIHAARMVEDQAIWISQAVQDIIYKTAAHTATHEATP